MYSYLIELPPKGMARAPGTMVFCFLFGGTESLSAFLFICEASAMARSSRGLERGGLDCSAPASLCLTWGTVERMSIHKYAMRTYVPWLPPPAVGAGCLAADGDTPGPVVGVSFELSVTAANVIALVVRW